MFDMGNLFSRKPHHSKGARTEQSPGGFHNAQPPESTLFPWKIGV